MSMTSAMNLDYLVKGVPARFLHFNKVTLIPFMCPVSFMYVFLCVY